MGNLYLHAKLPHGIWYHSHKKWKDSLDTRPILLIFSYREYIKTAKNGGFCEELLSENDFQAVLATFCCYDYGAKDSKEV